MYDYGFPRGPWAYRIGGRYPLAMAGAPGAAVSLSAMPVMPPLTNRVAFPPGPTSPPPVIRKEFPETWIFAE